MSKNVADSGNPGWLRDRGKEEGRERVLLVAHCSKLRVGPRGARSYAGGHGNRKDTNDTDMRNTCQQPPRNAERERDTEGGVERNFTFQA